MLRERADSAKGDRLAIRFHDHSAWVEWSWREYWAAAESAASSPWESGVRPCNHVLVLLPQVRQAVPTLFGLWILGAVHIQIGLPSPLPQQEQFLANLNETADRLHARFLLTSAEWPATAGKVRVIQADFLSHNIIHHAPRSGRGSRNGLPAID